jgi:nucleotide-binding universal stress UspA family protein
VEDGVRRIIVGVDGSVGSLRALRRGVAEARLTGATVYAVLAWTPPGGELIDRRAPSAHLRRFWERSAWEELQKAWTEALGGYPADVSVRLMIARGNPGHVLVTLADEETDLLVVGAGSRNPVRRALGGSVSRYCTARARCSVLAVPPSPLARKLLTGTRRRRAVDELVGHAER